jgi:hypothetical protein
MSILVGATLGGVAITDPARYHVALWCEENSNVRFASAFQGYFLTWFTGAAQSRNGSTGVLTRRRPPSEPGQIRHAGSRLAGGPGPRELMERLTSYDAEDGSACCAQQLRFSR